jgi:D-serine deaminase-like pyridoxal phosphate-dependent protein
MPFAWLDLDALRWNTERTLERAGSKRVRVASKSVRSVPVLRRLLDADPRIEGLMCFTATEAVHLASLGFDDLLVAYPTWDPRDVEAVAETVGGGAHITLTVDSHDHVEHVEAVAERVGVTLPVSLEVDASRDLPGVRFGVWRSPLRDVGSVVAVARRVATSRSLTLDGLMMYEAQIAGVPDRGPGQAVRGALIRGLKGRDVQRIAQLRADVVGALREAGLPLRFVNGGGTGSLESTAHERAVTEVTVGSGFYAPALFDHYDAFELSPAAGYAVEVVRRPAPGTYTCLGGGYLASGVPGPDKAPVVHLPRGARLTDTEGAGEVQTPVLYDGPVDLQLGDPVFLRHAKAGELCERFTHLVAVSGDEVVDELTTYRGDGLCFL